MGAMGGRRGAALRRRHAGPNRGARESGEEKRRVPYPSPAPPPARARQPPQSAPPPALMERPLASKASGTRIGVPDGKAEGRGRAARAGSVDGGGASPLSRKFVASQPPPASRGALPGNRVRHPLVQPDSAFIRHRRGWRGGNGGGTPPNRSRKSTDGHRAARARARRSLGGKWPPSPSSCLPPLSPPGHSPALTHTVFQAQPWSPSNRSGRRQRSVQDLTGKGRTPDGREGGGGGAGRGTREFPRTFPSCCFRRRRRGGRPSHPQCTHPAAS